uniref:Uncharacterized protein LOC102808357 n=1 Tax=Saccoglossus kowalevskii TaxID=10224 RepID=A0ABM0MNS6_SACKO|nr:PREDICTED: uncharacterized protein LOC102808357 [Saccoglossus kowalevskii]
MVSVYAFFLFEKISTICITKLHKIDEVCDEEHGHHSHSIHGHSHAEQPLSILDAKKTNTSKPPVQMKQSGSKQYLAPEKVTACNGDIQKSKEDEPPQKKQGNVGLYVSSSMVYAIRIPKINGNRTFLNIGSSHLRIRSSDKKYSYVKKIVAYDTSKDVDHVKFRDFSTPFSFAGKFNSVLTSITTPQTPTREKARSTESISTASDSGISREILSEEFEDAQRMESSDVSTSVNDGTELSSPLASSTPSNGRKRQMSEAAKHLTVPALTKKKKAQEVNRQLEIGQIKECHIGTYLIDSTSLSLSRQIRNINESWVEKLVHEMDEYLDETYLPLIVVLKNGSKDDLIQSNVKMCKERLLEMYDSEDTRSNGMVAVVETGRHCIAAENNTDKLGVLCDMLSKMIDSEGVD